MEPSDVTVRPAEIDDSETCLRYDYAHVDPDERRCEIGRRDLLPADRGEVVGFLELDRLWSHIPYVGFVMVDEEHRHMGFRDIGVPCGPNDDGGGEVFFRRAL